jgi:hypothetical protein
LQGGVRKGWEEHSAQSCPDRGCRNPEIPRLANGDFVFDLKADNEKEEGD